MNHPMAAPHTKLKTVQVKHPGGILTGPGIVKNVGFRLVFLRFWLLKTSAKTCYIFSKNVFSFGFWAFQKWTIRDSPFPRF